MWYSCECNGRLPQQGTYFKLMSLLFSDKIPAGQQICLKINFPQISFSYIHALLQNNVLTGCEQYNVKWLSSCECWYVIICNIIKKNWELCFEWFQTLQGGWWCLTIRLWSYILTYLLYKTYTPHDVHCSTLHVNSFLISLFGRGVGAE